MIKKTLFPLLFVLLSFNAFAATTVTALYPDSDTCLDPLSTSTSFSTASTCTSTGASGSNGSKAMILHFDLSSISDSSTILEAKMRIAASNRGYQGQDHWLRRILQNTNVSQATWNVYSTGNNWGTAGAQLAETDYTDTNRVTVVPPSTDDVYVTVDVTNLVKDMIDNGNYGFLLRAKTNNAYISWKTSESTGTSLDPLLTIRTSATPSAAITWYVRPNGGTCGINNQCQGDVDADFVSGTNGACACNSLSAAASVTRAGDTVLVRNGTYNSSAAVFPAGTDSSHTTKIYGEGYEDCTDVTAVTSWNNNAISLVTIGSNSDLQCLTLTDHNEYGNPSSLNLSDGVANNGIVITRNANNINIKNVRAYGLYRGIFAHMTGDMTLTNVELVGNWSAGWDGDGSNTCTASDGSFSSVCATHNCSSSAQSCSSCTNDIANNCAWLMDRYYGTKVLNNVTIDWNGCATKYPLVNSSNLVDPDNFQYCCAQSQQCYGDGIAGGGDGPTGNWVVNGGSFSHNTSDGWDTLHGSGGYLYIKKLRAEGNVGNQVKTSQTDLIMEDSKIIGNCSYFYHQPFSMTPTQHDNRVGWYNGNPQVSYVTLTGSGISESGETLNTGNGSTTVFTGTLAHFPIKKDSPYVTIHYTQGGNVRSATSSVIPSSGTGFGQMYGYFSGTGVSSATTGTTGNWASYINYQTGAYKITFTSAPDNLTSITADYIYNDALAGGTYSGSTSSFSNITWDAEIDGNGTPDTFKWREGSGTYTTGVAITGASQTLSNGVSIVFKETTGHTIGDVYHFSTVGNNIQYCRALGGAFLMSAGSGSTAKLYNNTFIGNGDTMIEKNGSCVSTDRIVMRNNILLGGIDSGAEYNNGVSDKSRLLYISNSTCDANVGIHTLFDSDYDTMCDGKTGSLTDCTSEGANNLCYASCASVGLATTPAIGPDGSYYTGVAFPVDLDVASSSVATADKTIAGADIYDYNGYDRGATWDRGAVEYGSIAVTCSNSIQDGLEEGVDCGGICPNVCPTPTPTCGNNLIEAGETCDDGNTTSGDGCSDVCIIEVPPDVCGDGIVSAANNETCDDGNTVNGDGCSSVCLIEPPRICGDHILDTDLGEECDDGNTTAGDGCSATCTLEYAQPTHRCGDGILDPPGAYINNTEQCDDGNVIVGDGCSPNCRIETSVPATPTGNWNGVLNGQLKK